MTHLAGLYGSTGDEEPLVDAAVDRSRRKVLALGDVGELALVNTVGRAVEGGVGTIPVSCLHRTQVS